MKTACFTASISGVSRLNSCGQRVWVLLLALMLALTSARGATNYVSLVGAHLPPFDTWGNAATNIQAAVDLANAGDVVLVGPGSYGSGSSAIAGLPTRLVVTNQIQVIGVDGSESTEIISTPQLGERGIYLRNGAMVRGLSVRHFYGGGVESSTGCHVNECLIEHCEQSSGGRYHKTMFRFCPSGAVKNADLDLCQLYYNFAGYSGGGANNCNSTGCIFYGNVSERTAAMDWGTATNCLFEANTGLTVVGSAKLVNCTVVRNHLPFSFFAAVHDCDVTNSIIYHNTSIATNPNYEQSRISTSCTFPPAEGLGNISADPRLSSMIGPSLLKSSPCIDSGSVVDGVTVDLQGDPRNVPDMGCDEYVSNPMDMIYGGRIASDSTSAVVHAELSFSAHTTGQYDRVEWRFGDGSTAEDVASIRHAFTHPGNYEVEMSLVGSSSTKTYALPVQILDSFTNHVSLAGGHVPPFDSWGNASTNLQAAIVAAPVGGTILVQTGRYENLAVSAAVAKPYWEVGKGSGYDYKTAASLFKPVILKAFHADPNLTSIVGPGTNTFSGARYIGVELTPGAKINGICIENATAAGVLGPRDSMVDDCIIQNCGLSGAMGCFVTKSIIQGNGGNAYGGGAVGAILHHCVVRNNFAGSGGGGEQLQHRFM